MLSTCLISIYLLIYIPVVFDQVSLIIMWLHVLWVNIKWIKSGMGNIVLNNLKQRKNEYCSIVSQSIFLHYFLDDHCLKKMVTTM